nr:hypothetical protein CFP56_77018 [Quercus suber]
MVFFDLPVDIRSRIYQHVFASTHFILDKTLRVPGVLCANKQFRLEALDFFYELSIFHLCSEAMYRLGALSDKHFDAITEIHHHGCDSLLTNDKNGAFPNRSSNLLKSFPIVFAGKTYAKGKKIKPGVLKVEKEYRLDRLRRNQARGRLCA